MRTATAPHPGPRHTQSRRENAPPEKKSAGSGTVKATASPPTSGAANLRCLVPKEPDRPKAQALPDVPRRVEGDERSGPMPVVAFEPQRNSIGLRVFTQAACLDRRLQMVRATLPPRSAVHPGVVARCIRELNLPSHSTVRSRSPACARLEADDPQRPRSGSRARGNGDLR